MRSSCLVKFEQVRDDLILIPSKIHTVCPFNCNIQSHMGGQQIIRHMISLIKVTKP